MSRKTEKTVERTASGHCAAARIALSYFMYAINKSMPTITHENIKPNTIGVRVMSLASSRRPASIASLIFLHLQNTQKLISERTSGINPIPIKGMRMKPSMRLVTAITMAIRPAATVSDFIVPNSGILCCKPSAPLYLLIVLKEITSPLTRILH